MTLESTDPTPAEEPQTQTQEEPPEEPAATGDAEPEPETADASADGADDDGQPKPDGKHKRKGGFQRTIENLKRENEMLREMALARQQQQAPPSDAPTKDATPEEKLAGYLKGIVAEQYQAAEAQRRQQEAVNQFQARTQEVRSQLPDFDEVVHGLDVQVGSPMGQAIFTSPEAPRIMYLLASNPEELARIRALPPLDAVRAIGRLEAQASATASPKGKPSAAPRKPATPAPISPVTARGATTVKPVKDMSYEEYDAWRRRAGKR